MSALGHLLERLRRVRLPPGAAAGVMAVPSTGDELSHEVAFLFGQLDEAERRGELLLSAARAAAAELELAAGRTHSRMLEEARSDGERVATELLAASRDGCERRARGMLTEAGREAERVLARGRERIPSLVDAVVAKVLDGGL